MSDASATLHLFHTRPDPRWLAAWAARHGLMQQQGDLGYALHGLLRAVFGELAPQPFHYVDADQGLLAYLGASPETVAQCVALADADVAAALGVVASSQGTGYSLRRFPTVWPAEHVLGFDVRVRPVLRTAKGERDAFLCAVDAAGDASAREPLNRAEVYAQWLQAQLAPREGEGGEPWHGSVTVRDVRMTRYQRLGVMRKTQPGGDAGARRPHIVSGPDIELSGRLQVVEPGGFAALLARGVGRHRAFGFGMLRLRPADR